MDLAFLTYAPRSGSTFLAQKLNDSGADLVVLPEFKLPRILLLLGDEAVRQMDVSDLLRVYRQDRQLHNLGITEAEFSQIVERHVGESVAEITMLVVRRLLSVFYGLRDSPSTVVIKDGALLFLHEQARAAFPHSKFLHIYRDGRAVANSMLRTESVYSKNETMGGGNILRCARSWKNQVLVLDNAQRSGVPLIVVRYESLLENTESVVANVMNELVSQPALVPVGDGGAGCRPSVVSTAEQSLHRLANQPALATRGEAWQAELPTWQGVTFELAAGRALKSLGYEPWYRQRTSRLATGFAVGRAWSVHLYDLVRRLACRIRQFVADPEQAKVALQFSYLFHVRRGSTATDS